MYKIAKENLQYQQMDIKASKYLFFLLYCSATFFIFNFFLSNANFLGYHSVWKAFHEQLNEVCNIFKDNYHCPDCHEHHGKFMRYLYGFSELQGLFSFLIPYISIICFSFKYAKNNDSIGNIITFIITMTIICIAEYFGFIVIGLVACLAFTLFHYPVLCLFGFFLLLGSGGADVVIIIFFVIV